MLPLTLTLININSVTLLLLGGCHPKVWLISYGFQYWLQYISSLFVHCLLHNSVAFSSSLGQFTEYKNMHQLNIGKPSSYYWTNNSPISVASCKVKIKWSTLCLGVSLWEILEFAIFGSLIFYLQIVLLFFQISFSRMNRRCKWDATIFFEKMEYWSGFSQGVEKKFFWALSSR